MLLGIWENIEDLESKLNLAELTAILDISRKKEHERNRFLAAIQGIDIDKASEERNKERFEAVQERANKRLYGEQAVKVADLDFFNLDIEFEE